MALVKRTRPIPAVGHYDNTADLYIRFTQPRVKTLYSQSQDKIPKAAFKPRDLHPEPTQDLEHLMDTETYFKFSNSNKR